MLCDGLAVAVLVLLARAAGKRTHPEFSRKAAKNAKDAEPSHTKLRVLRALCVRFMPHWQLGIGHWQQLHIGNIIPTRPPTPRRGDDIDDPRTKGRRGIRAPFFHPAPPRTSPPPASGASSGGGSSSSRVVASSKRRDIGEALPLPSAPDDSTRRRHRRRNGIK